MADTRTIAELIIEDSQIGRNDLTTDGLEKELNAVTFSDQTHPVRKYVSIEAGDFKKVYNLYLSGQKSEAAAVLFFALRFGFLNQEPPKMKLSYQATDALEDLLRVLSKSYKGMKAGLASADARKRQRELLAQKEEKKAARRNKARHQKDAPANQPQMDQESEKQTNATTHGWPYLSEFQNSQQM